MNIKSFFSNLLDNQFQERCSQNAKDARALLIWSETLPRGIYRSGSNRDPGIDKQIKDQFGWADHRIALARDALSKREWSEDKSNGMMISSMYGGSVRDMSWSQLKASDSGKMLLDQGWKEWYFAFNDITEEQKRSYDQRWALAAVSVSSSIVGGIIGFAIKALIG